MNRIAAAADAETGTPIPWFKVFRSPVGRHVLVVPHSRIFDVDEAFGDALAENRTKAVETLSEAALARQPGEQPLDDVPDVTPQSISLNVSARCNLACAYCYAGRGRFDGAQEAGMTWPVARTAIDGLLARADATAPVTIGFMGGEPFANRALIHRTVAYAAAAGAGLGFDVRFSVTTNGTLVNDDDVALLRRHPFAVTVSVDGGARIQDQQRPLASGAGSWERVARGVRTLLESPGSTRIAARVTVMRDAIDLPARFAELVGAGFPEIGFSPVRQAPDGGGALRDEDWPRYLASTVALAREELARALAGTPIRFTNFAVALRQLHRGWSSPYACGAGAGYFSVAADGDWYACHRAIGDASYRLGDASGLDATRRSVFLRERHVHAQEPCRSCWARYLCSGGCHREAASRSDASCDFIRGWLEACLAAYCELSARRPEWFTGGAREGT